MPQRPLARLRRTLVNHWRRLWRRELGVIRLRISAPLPLVGALPTWWQRRVLGRAPAMTLDSWRSLVDRIIADPRSHTVLIEIEAAPGGWATITSLRSELARLRAAGRRVVARLHQADLPCYALACAAEQIVLPRESLFAAVGLRLEVRFLAAALASVGIAADVAAVSPYKSGGDTFTRRTCSPEAREQLERLLDGRYAAALAMIADGRGMAVARVQQLIDGAPYGADAARDAGLVDAVCYDDELPALLGRGGRPATFIADAALERQLCLPPVSRSRPLAVISIAGTIARGADRRIPLPLPLFGGAAAGALSVSAALRAAEADRRVAAVVLAIDSPGGDAFASDQIWREVERVRRRKPVIALLGDVAASGGYYVAAAANHIVAQPGTITGSIGVFVLRPTIAGLYQRIGVDHDVLGRGANHGFFEPTTPPDATERDAIARLLDDTYQAFLRRVADGRAIAADELATLAGGRVWLGSEAHAHRLVDTLGGLADAIAAAQRLAGLPGDPAAPLRLVRVAGAPPAAPPFPDAARLLGELVRPAVWLAAPIDLQFDHPASCERPS